MKYFRNLFLASLILVSGKSQTCYLPFGYVLMPQVYVAIDSSNNIHFTCNNLSAIPQFNQLNCPGNISIPSSYVAGEMVYIGLTYLGDIHIGTTRNTTWSCCQVDIFQTPALGEWPVAMITIGAAQPVKFLWGAPGQPIVNLNVPSTLNCVVSQTPGQVNVTCQ